MNIFQSAVQKLTLWYVGALLVVCLAFSVPTYLVSADRLEHGARRQAEIIQEVGPFGQGLPARIAILRDEQLERDRRQLLRTIVLADLAILALGAFGSYRFARRTLAPIEEAHEAQARFTTDASHELRTPLATMQAEIEVALRGPKLTGTQAKQVLQSNLEEIARLRTLSERLLDLARSDKPEAFSEVALSEIIQTEVTRLQKQHPAATIEAQITPDLAIHGDAKLLRQLVAILADNAITYAGPNPAKLKIALTRHNAVIQLTVTDHGVGIKATELPHIFDRFYRGSNASVHHTSGHGLGLSLAQQITVAHGGTISASSHTGQTTFTVTLPPHPTS